MDVAKASASAAAPDPRSEPPTVGRGVEPGSDADRIAIGCHLGAVPPVKDPERLSDQPGARVADAIALVEPLVRDPARRIEHEDAWIGQVHVLGVGLDTVERVILLDALVNEAEALHHLAALVGEQRIADAVLLRKLP